MSPKNILTAEKSRSTSFENTNIDNLFKEAKALVNDEVIAINDTYECKLENKLSAEEAYEVLINLSNLWYKHNYFSISGYFATKIAERTSKEKDWIQSAIIFNGGISSGRSEKHQLFCRNNAIKAYENVILPNPTEIDHKIALVYC